MKRHALRARYLSFIVLSALLFVPVALQITHSVTRAAQGQVSVTRDESLRQLQEHYGFDEPQHTGGTVTVGERQEIGHVNGMLTQEWPTRHITSLLFESLVSVSPIDGSPVPQLADYWETSADRLTYTFHLNQRATWHDGVDVTASDVKFSFDIAKLCELGVDRGSLFFAEMPTYSVVDDDTFKMVLNKPYVTFLYDVVNAVPIMPEHIWGDIPARDWGNDPGSTGEDPTRVVGTGPFKFRAWDRGKSITLVRNDDHYATKPFIDTFVMQFTLPQPDRVLALQQGTVDIIEGINGNDIAKEQQAGSLHFTQFDLARLHGYVYNLDPERTPFFGDERVRKALFVALDREAIVGLYSYAEVAIGTQPPLSDAYAPERMPDSYDHNPNRAKELLAEAGWVDTDDDGILDKDGRELRFSILTNYGGTGVSDLVGAMISSWRAIGIKADEEPVSWETLLARRDAHDFDVFITTWRLNPSWNQAELFRTDLDSCESNLSGYQNAEYDRVDDMQLLEADPERRRELLILASTIAWNDLPIGVLRFIGGSAAWNSRVHNFEPREFGGVYWSIPFVWVDA